MLLRLRKIISQQEWAALKTSTEAARNSAIELVGNDKKNDGELWWGRSSFLLFLSSLVLLLILIIVLLSSPLYIPIPICFCLLLQAVFLKILFPSLHKAITRSQRTSWPSPRKFANGQPLRPDSPPSPSRPLPFLSPQQGKSSSRSTP